MFEIDCHITSDGHVVVSHDDCLKRATGQDVRISETLYEDLPPLHQSLRLEFQWRHVTVSNSEDRKIPLLSDLFDKFPDTPVNIDIKINNDELIKKVSDLVKSFKREHLTVWGNRSDVITRKCFAENPSIPLLFSMRRVIVLLALYYSGLLPFVPLKEMAYEVIMLSPLLRKGTFHTEYGWKARTLVKISDFLLMSKGLFNHLTQRGIQSYLWVLNEEQDFERAFCYGATGVMTDFPTKLRQYLDQHPEYEAK